MQFQWSNVGRSQIGKTQRENQEVRKQRFQMKTTCPRRKSYCSEIMGSLEKDVGLGNVKIFFLRWETLKHVCILWTEKAEKTFLMEERGGIKERGNKGRKSMIHRYRSGRWASCEQVCEE